MIAAAFALAVSAAAAPPAPPSEEHQSRIRVRALMQAVNFNRFDDLPEVLAENAVLVGADGAEIVGPAAIVAWFRAEFGGGRCGFSARSDAGHLNDNSIYYGRGDLVMVELRLVVCNRPRTGPRDGDPMTRSVMRFITPIEGRIQRIEAAP